MADPGSVGSSQRPAPCPSAKRSPIGSKPSPMSFGIISPNPNLAFVGSIWASIRAKISCSVMLDAPDTPLPSASIKSLLTLPLPSGLSLGLSSILSFENSAFIFLTSSLVWLVVVGEVLSSTKSRMDLTIGSKPSSFGSHHFCSSGSGMPQTSAILLRKVGGYMKLWRNSQVSLCAKHTKNCAAVQKQIAERTLPHIFHFGQLPPTPHDMFFVPR